MSTSSYAEAVKVNLKKRPEATGAHQNGAPVWAVSQVADGSEETAPLNALCDKHDRPDKVCCRELKGEDERTLLDPDIVRDAVIGFSDGITVPFGLTAGLASLGDSRIVILGGVAELISGAISMGIGGFLASQADRDHYLYLRRQTHDRVQRSCAGEMEREVHEILGPFGLDQSVSRRIAGCLLKSEAEFQSTPPADASPSWFSQLLRRVARTPSDLKDAESQRNGSLAGDEVNLKVGDEDVGMTAFLLRFGEGMECVPTSRLWISAMTIGLGYLVGGFIPLIPYFVTSSALVGLYWSIGVTGLTLIVFGLFKTYYTGAEVGFYGYVKGSAFTLTIGGLAAAAAWAVVRALE